MRMGIFAGIEYILQDVSLTRESEDEQIAVNLRISPDWLEITMDR